MTDDLYHRQLESMKLENMATTDLIDMLRERDKRIEKLEEQNRKLLESCEGATMMYEDLCKAKEIILKLSTCLEGHSNNNFEYELLQEAEQFLKE